MDMPDPNTVGELRGNLQELRAKLIELNIRSADTLVRLGEIQGRIEKLDESHKLDPDLERMNADVASSTRSLHGMILSEPPDILWPC
ncbi:MAG: hypothetical protein IPF66_22275 [Holophagales bacterium]|nr:hypothetical protein [Holophagales bacterium]